MDQKTKAHILSNARLDAADALTLQALAKCVVKARVFNAHVLNQWYDVAPEDKASHVRGIETIGQSDRAMKFVIPAIAQMEADFPVPDYDGVIDDGPIEPWLQQMILEERLTYGQIVAWELEAERERLSFFPRLGNC